MMPDRTFFRLLGFILLAEAALLVPILSCSTLSRIDETQIAEVSREMVEAGDWVTPRIGGVPFAAYPPLQYWLLSASGAVFGFNEFSMRLPTALAAVGLVGILALVVRRLAGAESGLVAGMILGVTPAFYQQGIVCRADVITMFFALAAFDRFVAWTGLPGEGGRRPRDLALMYLCIALGFLTKGPLVVAMLGLGGLAWFLVSRQWGLLIEMKLWIGIPAVLLIVVPWYAAVHGTSGAAFLRENLLSENLSAYTEGYQQKRPWTFYLRQFPLLVPGLLAILLAGTVYRAPGVGLTLLWFLLTALFFQVSSAKRINYMAYMAPPLAAAAGTTLAAVWQAAPALFRRCLFILSGIVAVAGAVLMCIPSDVWSGSSVIRLAGILPVLGGALTAAALAVAATAGRFGGRAGFGATIVSFGLACVAFGGHAKARMNPDYREMAEFCRLVGSRVPGSEDLSVLHPGVEGFWHFYIGRTLRIRSGEPGLYLVTQPQLDAFRVSGKRIDVLESLPPDARGRSRYLLRIS